LEPVHSRERGELPPAEAELPGVGVPPPVWLPLGEGDPDDGEPDGERDGDAEGEPDGEGEPELGDGDADCGEGDPDCDDGELD
jgi:hypothetical protein